MALIPEYWRFGNGEYQKRPRILYRLTLLVITSGCSCADNRFLEMWVHVILWQGVPLHTLFCCRQDVFPLVKPWGELQISLPAAVWVIIFLVLTQGMYWLKIWGTRMCFPHAGVVSETRAGWFCSYLLVLPYFNFLSLAACWRIQRS